VVVSRSTRATIASIEQDALWVRQAPPADSTLRDQSERKGGGQRIHRVSDGAGVLRNQTLKFLDADQHVPYAGITPCHRSRAMDIGFQSIAARYDIFETTYLLRPHDGSVLASCSGYPKGRVY